MRLLRSGADDNPKVPQGNRNLPGEFENRLRLCGPFDLVARLLRCVSKKVRGDALTAFRFRPSRTDLSPILCRHDPSSPCMKCPPTQRRSRWANRGNGSGRVCPVPARADGASLRAGPDRCRPLVSRCRPDTCILSHIECVSWVNICVLTANTCVALSKFGGILHLSQPS